MSKVAVIIINYNSSAYTIDCLKSIFSYTPCDFQFEIVVVDNNSMPRDYEKIAASIKSYDRIKLLKSKVNLGFSGGNMFALQNLQSNAQYVFFLNNDCELLNSNLEILYNFMQSHPSAGICTGQMFNSNRSFHHSFNYFPTLKLKLFGSSVLRFFSPANYPSRRIEYKSALKVPYVTGAAMFIDFKVFNELGGFDTNYFLYCEEEDICYRLKNKGYDAYIVPDAKFIHHIGKSTKRNFTIERENYISLLYFLRKHFTLLEYIGLIVIYFFKNAKKMFRGRDYLKLAFFIIRGAPEKYSLRYKQGSNTN